MHRLTAALGVFLVTTGMIAAQPGTLTPPPPLPPVSPGQPAQSFPAQPGQPVQSFPTQAVVQPGQPPGMYFPQAAAPAQPSAQSAVPPTWTAASLLAQSAQPPAPQRSSNPAAVTDASVSPGVLGVFLDMGAAPQFGRSWVSADYLMWWLKSAPLAVPVVTTSDVADAGVLGRPTTQVLFGNQPLSAGLQSGVLLNLGHWFDANEIIGVEASFFYFGDHDGNDFSARTSSSNQVLAVPYSTPAGVPSSFVMSGTNASGNSVVGGISANSSSSLWGAEVNGLVNLVRADSFQINLLGGFRSIFLEESLNLNYETQLPPGSGFGSFYNANLADQFSTRNQFYGGQLGVKGEWTKGVFYGSLAAKVALGVNHETVNINGQFSDPYGVFYPYGAGPGGLFAQRTNIGSYSGNSFCVVPELQLKLGVNVTSWMQLYVGYDFLFLSQVVRPGDQIDPVINTSQAGPNSSGGGTASPLIGAARPMPLFAESTFWAQGVNFGLQFTF